jgi:DNA-binding GntR family transcriptional regulator
MPCGKWAEIDTIVQIVSKSDRAHYIHGGQRHALSTTPMPRPSIQMKQWLEQTVPGMEPGARLPSDPELAAQWDISLRTAKTVLKELSDQGILTRVPGRGTFVPKTKTVRMSELPVASGSRDTVIEGIARSIASGEFRVGEPLPSIKYVSVQFRVSPRTVVAAYRDLRERGLINKVGKSFWVGKFVEAARNKPRKLVYLFHDNRHRPAHIFRGDLLSVAYQRMEEELGNHQLVLRCEDISRAPSLIAHWDQHRDQPAGMAFFRMQNNPFDRCYELLNQRAGPRGILPSRVLVDWQQGVLDLRTHWLQVVSRGSILTAYARTLAQYLARRSGPIAVVFMEKQKLWDEYAYLFPMLRLWVELEHTSPGQPRKFFVLARRVGEGFLASQLYRGPLHERAQQQLSKYEQIDPERFNRDVSFVQTFEQALEKLPDTTTWVFASERCAADAVEVLRRAGRRVPADTEVVGLENDPAWYHLGITYCGPDWQRLGYMMAHALIGDISLERTGKGFLRSGAMVRERLTTRD